MSDDVFVGGRRLADMEVAVIRRRRTKSHGSLVQCAEVLSPQAMYYSTDNHTRSGWLSVYDGPMRNLSASSVWSFKFLQISERELLIRSSSHEQDLAISLVDRSGVTIREVHRSVSCRPYCFQVQTANETKFVACSNEEEYTSWIRGLKELIWPERDRTVRLDTSLSVWIVEVKGVTHGKRYFCELMLDKVLHARTSVKSNDELLFWGEQFQFSDLPPTNTLLINMFSAADGKKKKKPDRNGFIGSSVVDLYNLQTNSEFEKWFPLHIPDASPSTNPKTTSTSSTTTGSVKKDEASLRMKLKYDVVVVLPLSHYNNLLKYLGENYLTLTQTLETSVNLKTKDDVTQTLLKIFYMTGTIQDYLVDLITNDVTNTENKNLLFRGNTMATKSIDMFMKMVGGKYLEEALGNFVRRVYSMTDDTEVDPEKIRTSTDITNNQKILVKLVEEVWHSIQSSLVYFPHELQMVFYLVRKNCETIDRDLSKRLTSASIFLRFLCPAILSPNLFQLTQEYPSDKIARTLTLVAKTIQNLANFTRFGSKEDYMKFLNAFVEDQIPRMDKFLADISIKPKPKDKSAFHGAIDLGRELSVVYHLFKRKQEALVESEKLSTLVAILHELDEVYALSASANELRDSSREPMSSLVTDLPLSTPYLHGYASSTFSTGSNTSIGKCSPFSSSNEIIRTRATTRSDLAQPDLLKDVLCANSYQQTSNSYPPMGKLIGSNANLEARFVCTDAPLSGVEDYVSGCSLLKPSGSVSVSNRAARRITGRMSASLNEPRFESHRGVALHQARVISNSNSHERLRDASPSMRHTAVGHSRMRNSAFFDDSPTKPMQINRSNTYDSSSPRVRARTMAVRMDRSITGSSAVEDRAVVDRAVTMDCADSSSVDIDVEIVKGCHHGSSIQEIIMDGSRPSSESSLSNRATCSTSGSSCRSDSSLGPFIEVSDLLDTMQITEHNNSNNNSRTGSCGEMNACEEELFTNQEVEDDLLELVRLRKQVVLLKDQALLREREATERSSSLQRSVCKLTETLAESEHRALESKVEADRQMKVIIDRLMLVESELSREQSEAESIERSRQSIIDTQQKRIASLERNNERLLDALTKPQQQQQQQQNHRQQKIQQQQRQVLRTDSSDEVLNQDQTSVLDDPTNIVLSETDERMVHHV